MSSSPVLLPILLLLVGLAIGVVIGYIGAIARRTTAVRSDHEQVAQLRAQAARWQARAWRSQPVPSRYPASVP